MTAASDQTSWERLDELCRLNGFPLTSFQLNRLQGFGSLLLEWNRKVNLISRANESNICMAHVLHSISPLFLLNVFNGARILDLGTGGGFPGIPIAILRDDVEIILLDSIAKKGKALQDMVQRMELKNIRVVVERAEEFAKHAAEPIHIVFARSVAPLVDLIKWTQPLGRKGSHAGDYQTRTVSIAQVEFRTPLLIAMKGGDLNEELAKALSLVPGRPPVTIDLRFQGVTESGLEDKKLVVVEL